MNDKTSRTRTFECLGGPLCGQKRAHGQRFCMQDKWGQNHYYRLTRVMTDDKLFLATYYHYFGTELDRAQRCPPCMVPGDRAFKAIRH
jgi:hypothetical protein